MSKSKFTKFLAEKIAELKTEGLYKAERVITSQQQAEIEVNHDQHVLNFCANNYLGLANSPKLIHAGKEALDKHGYGLASVRFICGTQDIHKELESKISEFLGTEDTILYSSCFDANGGLFETLLSEEDAIISDALNHASIIDGIRLCKAQRFRYANNNMEDLEKQLIAAKEARFKLIATDGIFSMDGIIANLKAICDLADKYDAMVMVDDSHAVGFMGKTGKGTPEHCGVADRIDIYTGTLGKALGGASGGYTSGKKEVIDWLRNRSRPYLFSNTLAPAIVGASIEVLALLKKHGEKLRAKLKENSEYFRKHMTKLGFNLIPGEHPIIPVMLGDAKLATEMANQLLKENIYVVGFSFPVVPKGQARIRTQMSAAHTKEQLDKAIAAFAKVGKSLGVI
ncbi:MAG TPA: glycine C-acetyltransferase [Gammaproteobacteria bacterium]|nr:glycine C-acetyltransferase [Gammaproteobacteria bacterium]